MEKYESPVVLANEELAEGVYAASGSDCYTATAHIHQTPETGRGDFRIQVDGRHEAKDHYNEQQRLHITFNLPVKYKSSQGTLESGDETNTLVIGYHYHNNETDNIGLGDLVVVADSGLAITNVYIEDKDYRLHR